MLVDDQPAKLLSYEVILESLRENLLRASSAREALEHLLRSEVAVVLIDVCMPEIDGFELAALIRDHPRCQNTAIIFISAIHLTDIDRLRGYEMGAVDYVPVPVVAEVLRAKVRVFAELYRKTRQLERLNQELELRVAERTSELASYAVRLGESERRRSMALAAGKMGSWDWDVVSGDCLWDEGQYRIFGVDPSDFEPSAETIAPLIDPDDLERMQEAWQRAVTGLDRSFELEFRVRRPDGAQRWCLGTAATTVDERNRVTRVSGTTMDITDRKATEEHQTYLAREVDHRARNILAVVQSIVRLTKASSIEDYVDAVNGRINALSISHTLLSESRWQGADLRRLVDQELAPYRTGSTEAVAFGGSDVLLDHRSAQAVGMILHELATNAAKYGALSVELGSVSLTWEVGPTGLILHWKESNGPSVSPPSSQGYGTRLVLGGLAQLGGKADFVWEKSGLQCTLLIPYGKGRAQIALTTGSTEAKIAGQRKVLLVEDEPLVALMMEDILRNLGFAVVGPIGNVARASEVARKQKLHAAILDVNIAGELVYPVAEILAQRGVPFAFVTGYGADGIANKYENAPILQKPIDQRALEQLFPNKQPQYKRA